MEGGPSGSGSNSERSTADHEEGEANDGASAPQQLTRVNATHFLCPQLRPLAVNVGGGAGQGGDSESDCGSVSSSDVIDSDSGSSSTDTTLQRGCRFYQLRRLPPSTVRRAGEREMQPQLRPRPLQQHRDAATDPAAQQEHRRLSVLQRRGCLDNPIGESATAPRDTNNSTNGAVVAAAAEDSEIREINFTTAVRGTTRRLQMTADDRDTVLHPSEGIWRELGLLQTQRHLQAQPQFATPTTAAARGQRATVNDAYVPLYYNNDNDGDDSNGSDHAMDTAVVHTTRGTGAAPVTRISAARSPRRGRHPLQEHGRAGRTNFAEGGGQSRTPAAFEVAVAENSVLNHTNRTAAQSETQPTSEATTSGPVLLHGARVATTEERRVRYLFHNRPRLQLTARPKVVSSIVLDHTTWKQPLCYVPLFLPCLHNAFYSTPLRAVLRMSWEADAFNPLSPSVTYSVAVEDTVAGVRLSSPQQVREQQEEIPSPRRPVRVPSMALQFLLPSAPLYYVPAATSHLALSHAAARNTQGESLDHAAPALHPFLPPSFNSLATTAEAGFVASRSSVALSSSMFLQNCRHLLYRCFCVRCAVASQAQALQADALMRGAAPFKFPCCSCLKVESGSFSNLFCMVCLLDALTLGAPCGCCCYHGLGTALYGWHLRFLLRVRYRIYAWTALDFLIMCCIPGLAVDQQGAELLLNGVPESPVKLQFMS